MKKSFIISSLIILLVLAGLVYFLMQKSPTQNLNNSLGNSPSVNTMSGNSQQTYNVNIQNFAFSPQTLTISKGDKIVWTNNDPTTHTITSDDGNELDSGLIPSGESYSHTFDNSGGFNYHCSIHTMMKGNIIVK